jgi:D-aminopeptidase
MKFSPLRAVFSRTTPSRQALEATEEAVYDALFQATTTTGSDGTLKAIPIDSVCDSLNRHALIR